MSPSSDWSRDDSRYLDGELEPHVAKRVEAEIERDPARAERLDTWVDAMDVWREDAQRAAGTFDASRTTAAVLARVGRGAAAADADAPALRTYAAAALVLLGLGAAGAAWLGPDPGRAPMLQSREALRMLEAGQLAHHGHLALTTYPQPAAPRSETER